LTGGGILLPRKKNHMMTIDDDDDNLTVFHLFKMPFFSKSNVPASDVQAVLLTLSGEAKRFLLMWSSI
jgi:hypothetical protein